MTAEITKYLQSKIKTNSKSANSPKSKSVCSSKSKRWYYYNFKSFNFII